MQLVIRTALVIGIFSLSCSVEAQHLRRVMPDYEITGAVDGRIDELGQVTFVGGYRDGDIWSGTGIWTVQSGEPILVAKHGQAAPGPPDGAIFDGIDNFYIVDATPDEIVFSSEFEVAGDDSFDRKRGYWSWKNGTITPIFWEGMQAPGKAPGERFEHVYFAERPSADKSILLSAQLTNSPSKVYTYHNTIWTVASGSPELLAEAGDPAPGLPGVAFKGFWAPWQDTTGQIVFSATLEGPDIDSSNDYSYWIGTPGNFELFVREGNQAWDLPEGVLFDSVVLGLVSGNTSHRVVSAHLEGPGIDETNDYALWSDRSGSFEMVFRKGDPAPGPRYDEPFELLSIQGFSDDRYIFGGALQGVGRPYDDADGIWIETENGIEELYVRGDQPPGLPPGSFFIEFGLIETNSGGQILFSSETSEDG